jgi:hypothetical protein
MHIYGREPTHQELERKVGLAAIGRYKGPMDKLHRVSYGDIFLCEPNEREKMTVDSGFQTLDPGSCQKALTRAKVKAAMTASKYKNIATNKGCRIWGESKDENVLHTEQHTFSFQLDANSVAQTDENLTGRFLPNIYKEEIGPIVKPRRKARTAATNALHTKLSAIMRSHDTQPPRPIAALEPSLREPYEDTKVPEQFYDSGDVEGVFGPYATNADAFVVYDAKKHIPCLPARSELTPLGATRKRKDSSHTDHEDKARRSKRTRTSSPRSRAEVSPNRHHARGKHDEENRRSREHSPPRSSHSSSVAYPFKCQDCETDDKAEEPHCHIRQVETHRSRLRSRSPNGGASHRSSVIRNEDGTPRADFHSRSPTHAKTHRSRRASSLRNEVVTRNVRHRSRSPVGSDDEAYTKTQIGRKRILGKQPAARKQDLNDSHLQPQPPRNACATDAESQHDPAPDTVVVDTTTSAHRPTLHLTHTLSHRPNTSGTTVGPKRPQYIPLKSIAQQDEVVDGISHNTPQPRRRIQREELKRFTPRMQQNRTSSRTQPEDQNFGVEDVVKSEDMRPKVQDVSKKDADTPQNSRKRSLDDSGPPGSMNDTGRGKRSKRKHDPSNTDHHIYVTNTVEKPFFATRMQSGRLQSQNRAMCSMTRRRQGRLLARTGQLQSLRRKSGS